MDWCNGKRQGKLHLSMTTILTDGWIMLPKTWIIGYFPITILRLRGMQNGIPLRNCSAPTSFGMVS